MKNSTLSVTLFAFISTIICGQSASAKSVTTVEEFFSPDGRIVTESTYPTDETSRQILGSQEDAGVNNILHKRDLAPTDNQPVVRMNRDTYYSFAVVDVSKGATITMPEIDDGKYMSVQPVTQDHRIQAMRYGPGEFELTTHTGTHLYLVIRLDATLTGEEAKDIQNKMFITAESDTEFSTEPVNEQSFNAVENALKGKVSAIVARDGANAIKGMFTDPRDDSQTLFSEEKYRVGAALGWGGAQVVDNVYETSENYSSDNCYQAIFEDPENEAFWSITVYDKQGFMFNDLANFSSNTATANQDGTYTVSFGCGDDAPNNLETANKSGVFNVGVRHYQPTEKVSDENYRILPTLQEMPSKADRKK
jgi:hypothetical protein